jgi:hypothetical protein
LRHCSTFQKSLQILLSPRKNGFDASKRVLTRRSVTNFIDSSRRVKVLIAHREFESSEKNL